MTGETVEVLFVDDEEDIRIATAQMLDLAGFPIRALADPLEALSLLSRNYAGILVTDIRMPALSGMDLLERAIAIDPDLPVIMITGHGDVNLAVDAMRAGAYDFVEKPFSTERILESVTRALEKRQLTLENRRLRDTVSARVDNLEARLVGRADIMINLRNRIRAVAQTPADVLIVGETGTGKEIVARAIHDLGSAKERPFVSINCAALSTGMLEPELFGYEAGAFAGAQRARAGKFEHARNGTIFLDEIDAMPFDVQTKLLRVLDERSITRLGSHEPISLNARFIAATKRNLQTESNEGGFREDLLYRLNTVTLETPSLAEIRDDIPLLFTLLVKDASARFRTEPRVPSGAVLANLMQRAWPGNVRELRNAAERFALGLDGAQEGAQSDAGTLSDRMMTFERETISAVLQANEGQLKPTYEALGISRKSLYEKMQRHGLDKLTFR